ncbi:MAG TPA: 3'-5' exonuclease [Bacteroidales bacterium]|nr:3'-5' exonuclease [Bacteroidales bacterium]
MKNKKYAENISPEELNELPLIQFPGEIILIDEPEDIKQHLPYLESQPILGFDTETRPSFRKGRRNKVALLQLSTADQAFLFRLNHTGLPDNLAAILANEEITKVGAAIKDDIIGLQEHYDFEPAGFIELQDFVKKFNIESNGLKKLSGIVLDHRISKSQRVTNWENAELTEPQLIYAATDAWVCYEIYHRLLTTN